MNTDKWRTIRISWATLEKLRRRAGREGIAVSRLLESLISAALDGERRTP